MIIKNTNLIIGELESGKTRGICFPEIKKVINEEKNLFILDNKEEYYPRFKEELESNGYKTWIINLRKPLKSNGFNILHYPYLLYKNKHSDEAVNLIVSIANNICVSNPEDFWENSSRDYLASLILILFENFQEEEINFMNLGILVQMLDTENEAEKLKNYFKRLNVTNTIYRLGSTTIFAPSETRGGIISTLKYKINAFFNREEILKILSINELDINNMDKKVAIFFEGKEGLNGVANILIDQLIMANNNLKTEFIFMLDNFNSLPKLANIEELTEYASLNKIKTYFITNCLEELKDLYGKYTFEKIANKINIKDISDLKIDQITNKVVYPSRPAISLKKIDTEVLNK